MNYEQMACDWAKAGVGSEGAVAFAVLHLATQIERIADGLDQLTGGSPEYPALLVDVLR